MRYSGWYTNHYGDCFFDRDKYEASLPPPVYGPHWLVNLYGPVSRFCLVGAAQKIDGWLRNLDEKSEKFLEPSSTAHRDVPKGVFLCGIASGLRHIQRRRVKPWLAMAAGTALVLGVASALGAGLVVGAAAALVALPVSTGLGAVGLLGALGGLRAVAEAGRACVNIPTGYSRRKEFLEEKKEQEDQAAAEEKSRLSPLCQALFDHERAAEKAAPEDRANWIYGLAKHFPEEFLEAARKTEKHEAASVPAARAPQNLLN